MEVRDLAFGFGARRVGSGVTWPTVNTGRDVRQSNSFSDVAVVHKRRDMPQK